MLVSHSPRLAAGLADLLAEIGWRDVPVAVAAGTADGRLGTSLDAVRGALAAADAGDGVIVLPDLGSAVLSVKLALQDADPARAVMVDAPFVEGAVAAAATAASGGDLAAVVAAAQGARDFRKL
ncbi:MAG: phosphoenolpyruvate---glycerone phosphotransferase subunit DhaM [Mycobacteriales bacterium]